MRPTLYDAAGGQPAVLALTAAMHARCLEDPELNHPFTHADADPEHVPRLAAYWAEVLGGPADFTRQYGDETGVLQLHAGQGDMGDLGARFETCFARAVDDAGLPDDLELRAALAAYMHWAVGGMVAHPSPDDVVPQGRPVPRWSWDGLVKA